MKKIYITGIGGMLGYYLSQEFFSNFEIYGCDIIDLGSKFHSLNFSLLDLTDFDRVEKDLLRISPDIIIHTAASINLDFCEKEKDLAFLINADVTENLVHIADRIGAQVIYISTDAVFDGNIDKAYSEEDVVNPINIYGASKLKGEDYILNSFGNHVVLRTNIYGWNIQDKVSFAEWIYYSLKHQKEISMYTDLFYSPVYVGDLFIIIKNIINSNYKGLYHAGGGVNCSKYDFAIALAEEFSFPKDNIRKSSFKDIVFTAARSPNMRLDSSKIQKKLNITIPGFKDGIKYLRKDAEKYGKL